MEVDDFGLEFRRQIGHRPVAFPVPDRCRQRLELAHLSDRVVAQRERFDLMAVATQQVDFCGEHAVFPAGLLVKIVGDEDFHDTYRISGRCL